MEWWSGGVVENRRCAVISSSSLDPWILDIGCWILRMLRGTGGAGETLGSARFQRASLRVPRKEPEPPGARPRDLTARRRDASATSWGRSYQNISTTMEENVNAE